MQSLAACPSGAWRVMEGLPMYPQNPVTARLRHRPHPSKEQNHPVRQSDPVRSRSSLHTPHHAEATIINPRKEGRPSSAQDIYNLSKAKFSSSVRESHHLYKLETGKGAISPPADIFVPSHYHSSAVPSRNGQQPRPATASRLTCKGPDNRTVGLELRQ